MKLELLRSKARHNDLEVEHLLNAAKARTPGLAAELQRLSHELGWSHTPHLADGSHVVPLARWAEVAGAYAEDGFDGLAPLAKDPACTSYVTSLLESLRSAEALDALLRFYADRIAHPAADAAAAWQLVPTCNLLVSIKGSVVPDERQAAVLRDFLVGFHAVATDEHQKAYVLYALRGVGDAASLDWIDTLADLSWPYAEAKAQALKAIRKRLKARTAE